MAGDGEDFSQFDLSREEKDRLIAEVVRYVLFKTYQSSGCPIKRDELSQIVTKNYRQRALPAAVINEAKRKLVSIFGYDLKELQRFRPSTKHQTRSSQQSASADQKSYVVISQLPSDVYRKYVEDIGSAHLTGFTFVIVSIVHLAGGKISEENLWQHLRRMGLQENDENHPVIGNVKLSLDALVQQRYLQKDKISGPEGNAVMYELAERALDGEVSQKIKDYISQGLVCILAILMQCISCLTFPSGCIYESVEGLEVCLKSNFWRNRRAMKPSYGAGKNWYRINVFRIEGELWHEFMY